MTEDQVLIIAEKYGYIGNREAGMYIQTLGTTQHKIYAAGTSVRLMGKSIYADMPRHEDIKTYDTGYIKITDLELMTLIRIFTGNYNERTA